MRFVGSPVEIGQFCIFCICLILDFGRNVTLVRVLPFLSKTNHKHVFYFQFLSRFLFLSFYLTFFLVLWDFFLLFFNHNHIVPIRVRWFFIFLPKSSPYLAPPTSKYCFSFTCLFFSCDTNSRRLHRPSIGYSGSAAFRRGCQTQFNSLTHTHTHTLNHDLRCVTWVQNTNACQTVTASETTVNLTTT